jgi:hypothetical protein
VDISGGHKTGVYLDQRHNRQRVRDLAEDRDVLDNGWDAFSIGERLTAFKEWKSKAAQTKVSNQRRLEAAVTPRSTARSAPVVTEDDAFLQGFNQARGIK